ncbi:MAG TPA: DinB family protein [Planctomycetes bacterium]|nr:DinB family protein [Planctomycetota bacterium]
MNADGSIPTCATDSLTRLGELLAVAGKRLTAPPEDLLALAPTVSGWSPAQHLFHLVLACDLSFRNVSSLVRERGRLIRDPEERHAEGLGYLSAGKLPRGRAEAPRFVRPPERIDFELLAELHREACEACAEFARDPAAVDRAPKAIPHQLLGDLSASEWLRFAEVHTAHHLAILDEVRAELGLG